MKISFNKIKKYLGETKVKPEELVKKIKLHLSDVESFEDYGKKYQDLIIGEIKEKEEHPNADKLGVYKVKIGEGKTVQVVAGDKELKVGDKVVYLPPKSKVPYNAYPERFDGIIQKTKIRGVQSDGMLASEKELGFSADHERVMTVQEDCKAGQDVATTLELNDHIIEIENKTLTIRPDTFGMIGIAREVSGFLDMPFKSPDWFLNPTKIKPKNIKKEHLPLKIVNKLRRLCPRYMAISMSNVKVQESPLWLKIFLSSIDIKPINNVVDITNYLMVITGQPLHAFDYDKVIAKDSHYKNKAVITIRTAKEGEKITTIDQKTRELNEKTVVICDSQNPIAIGGIMGGLETEIDENTKNIIIESANFNLYNIRKSSMSLGLVTDAVTRFSKGQDPNLCEPVLYKAVEMVKDLCNGKVASNIKDEHIELPKPHKLTFSLNYFQMHTGLNLSRPEIVKILSNVEIKEIKTNQKDLITLEIPTYRQDIKIPEDIHEEIARIYGYTKIKLVLPKREITSTPSNSLLDFEKKLRLSLKGLGANEFLTYNFVGEKLYKNCDIDIKNNYRLTNALSPELEYMRSTLIPSLLEKINPNINNYYNEFGIFEINKTHNKIDFSKQKKLPLEKKVLSMALTKDTDDIYYHIKHYMETLLKDLKSKDVDYELIYSAKTEKLPNHIKIILPMFDVNRAALISYTINKKKFYLGVIGELNLDVKSKLKLIQPVGVFEINVEKLKTISNYRVQRINFSKYPKITQDLCFILNKEVPYIALEKQIAKTLEKRDLNYIVKPVDIYQEKGAEEKKQITINITLQHKNKTLKDKDIKSIRDIIQKEVKKELDGELKN